MASESCPIRPAPAGVLVVPGLWGSVVPTRSKVPKDIVRRVDECKSHLKFLAEAMGKYKEEPDRYKQIAGELRVLLCSSRHI